MKNPIVIALIVVVGYLLYTRSQTTNKPTGSSGTTAGAAVGVSLDALVNDFAALLNSVSKAVAGSGSGDASNATETVV